MGIDARMFFLTQKNFDKQELTVLAHRLYEAFWGEPFFLYGDEHILQTQETYEQDGPDFEIPIGWNLVEVSLSGCYYGEGYERGPIHDHIAVAQWIEANVKDALVYYGGDSSSVVATPFGVIEREVIQRHFHEHGHRPYRGAFKLNCGREVHCTRCHVAMNDVGGGGNKTFYSCGGCNEKAITRNHGVVKRWRDGKEFFEVSQELE